MEQARQHFYPFDHSGARPIHHLSLDLIEPILCDGCYPFPFSPSLLFGLRNPFCTADRKYDYFWILPDNFLK